MSPWTEIDSMSLPDSNSSLLSEDTVTVYVGRKRKKFHIHKALLCYHSSFFSKALDGLFKEHEDRAVYLPDDNVEGFVLFVNWMYNAPPQIASTPAAMMALLALYIMADKFCIEELKNVSMDVVRASYRKNWKFTLRRSSISTTTLLRAAPCGASWPTTSHMVLLCERLGCPRTS